MRVNYLFNDLLFINKQDTESIFFSECRKNKQQAISLPETLLLPFQPVLCTVDLFFNLSTRTHIHGFSSSFLLPDPWLLLAGEFRSYSFII